MRVRSGWLGSPADEEDGSEVASVAEALRLAGGVESDREGVAMGWANSGEPEVIRYCGPTEKFVSWAAVILASTSSKQNRVARRIGASGNVVPPIMRRKGRKCQRLLAPIAASGTGFGA
jgi:hypothetical protein